MNKVTEIPPGYYDTAPNYIVERVDEMQELGLQLGDANAEIRRLEEERDNALRASRYETDLCQQALADLKLYQADAERYRWLRRFVIELSVGNDTLGGLVRDVTELDAAIAQQKETP